MYVVCSYILNLPTCKFIHISQIISRSFNKRIVTNEQICRRSGPNPSAGGVHGDAGWFNLSILRDAVRQGEETPTDRLLRARTLLFLPVPQRGMPALPSSGLQRRRRFGGTLQGGVHRLLRAHVHPGAHGWLDRWVINGELSLRQPQTAYESHHESQSPFESHARKHPSSRRPLRVEPSNTFFTRIPRTLWTVPLDRWNA